MQLLCHRLVVDLAHHRKDGSENTCILLFQNVKIRLIKNTITDLLWREDVDYYLDEKKTGLQHPLFSLTQSQGII